MDEQQELKEFQQYVLSLTGRTVPPAELSVALFKAKQVTVAKGLDSLGGEEPVVSTDALAKADLCHLPSGRRGGQL
jgi:hypothetical protein